MGLSGSCGMRLRRIGCSQLLQGSRRAVVSFSGAPSFASRGSFPAEASDLCGCLEGQS